MMHGQTKIKYTALLCVLTIVNGKLYRLVSHYCLITNIIVFCYSSFL